MERLAAVCPGLRELRGNSVTFGGGCGEALAELTRLTALHLPWATTNDMPDAGYVAGMARLHTLEVSHSRAVGLAARYAFCCPYCPVGVLQHCTFAVVSRATVMSPCAAHCLAFTCSCVVLTPSRALLILSECMRGPRFVARTHCHAQPPVSPGFHLETLIVLTVLVHAATWRRCMA